MALYMVFHAIPDAHIAYLSEHPEALLAYLEGVEPEPRRSFLDRLFRREAEQSLPDDWPTQEIEGIYPEVNHRQVEQFHYILNGTDARVSHAGCVFQTWFAPRAETVVVTIDGENFALTSDLVADLKGRIGSVSEDELRSRYSEAVGEPEPTDDDKEFLQEVFAGIVKACDQAIETGSGLMWRPG